jgi:hypothetical protein
MFWRSLTRTLGPIAAVAVTVSLILAVSAQAHSTSCRRPAPDV